MPKERLSMRKIREVLRLRYDRNMSQREIGQACSMGRSTVSEYLERARAAGISWPVNHLGDEELEKKLFCQSAVSSGKRPIPDWVEIHRELRGKGVTLRLLWQEYKAIHPEGYQYTQVCEHYRTWVGGCDPVMRHRHKAGEKLFVDYAGQPILITDPLTGEVWAAEVFLAVLGASNYTYAEGSWNQSLPEWISSHVHAFEFFGAVPEVVVPDNLKSGVTSPCWYEPELNPTYRELAEHYCVSVLPARVRKPRDKAKVENGVLQAERSILAPLRKCTFFSLEEANAAIRQKLIELNERPFQKLPGCRRVAFDTIDRPAMRPLPPTRYEYAEWKRATLGADYHVEVDGHHYSIPYRLIRQKVDIRITRQTIECFHRGVRVASHLRSEARGESTTIKEHMPLSHQRYLDVTPAQILSRAERIGPDVVALTRALLEKNPYLGMRSSLGVLRLAKEYGDKRLCRACQRAIAIEAISYKSVGSILKTGLDGAPLPATLPCTPPVRHENLRGSHYFN